SVRAGFAPNFLRPLINMLSSSSRVLLMCAFNIYRARRLSQGESRKAVSRKRSTPAPATSNRQRLTHVAAAATIAVRRSQADPDLLVRLSLNVSRACGVERRKTFAMRDG